MLLPRCSERTFSHVLRRFSRRESVSQSATRSRETGVSRSYSARNNSHSSSSSDSVSWVRNEEISCQLARSPERSTFCFMLARNSARSVAGSASPNPSKSMNAICPSLTRTWAGRKLRCEATGRSAGWEIARASSRASAGSSAAAKPGIHAASRPIRSRTSRSSCSQAYTSPWAPHPWSVASPRAVLASSMRSSSRAALDEHPQLGVDPEWLCDRDRGAPAKPRLPERAHARVGEPALVPPVRLRDHDARPIATHRLGAVLEPIHNRAPAPRIMAGHVRRAPLDAEIGVGGRARADDLLEQRPRLARVREHRMRRERRVRRGRLEDEPELGKRAVPARLPQRHPARGSGQVGAALGREVPDQLHLPVIILVRLEEELERAAGGLVLQVDPSRAHLLERERPGRELGDVPEDGILQALRPKPVGEGGQPPQLPDHPLTRTGHGHPPGGGESRSPTPPTTGGSRSRLNFRQLWITRRRRLTIS